MLEHHRSPTRDGAYVDAALTKTAAAGMHRDPAFNAPVSGFIYAQPLFVDGGAGGADRVLVVTETDDAYALDAATGAVVWHKNVGTAAPRTALPCGNITPLGITGTPVIDPASRTIYFDAMIVSAATTKHMVHALSIDDGSPRAGWPVDVSATVSSGGTAFNSNVQNQRGALAIVQGTLYVPYGGHWGDCGNYRGWVVGIPLANPAAPKAWTTAARGGGSWAPSGVASDGAALFIATGNTFGATQWSGGEAIIRLSAGPVFSSQAADYFAPSNWPALDAGDIDIGGTGPVLFDVPGATPSKLAVSLGKNGVAYLLDRTNLGGVGKGNGTTGEGLFSAKVATNEIINAAATYVTSNGRYVVFKGDGATCPSGQSGDLTAIKVALGSPPTFSTAWCANQAGLGSPMATTTDGQANAIVWGLGAEGSKKLVGFDGDTGAVVFNGGAAGDTMGGIHRYVTPIAAKGRIYVAGDNAVYAFMGP